MASDRDASHEEIRVGGSPNMALTEAVEPAPPEDVIRTTSEVMGGEATPHDGGSARGAR